MLAATTLRMNRDRIQIIKITRKAMCD